MPVSPTDEDELSKTNAEALAGAPSTGDESGSTTGSNDSAGSPAVEIQDDNKPKNIADAVRAALDSGKEQSSGSGEGEEKPSAADPKVKKPEEEEELGELTPEELASYKGKTQRRFKQFQEREVALKSEIDKQKPEVDNWRRVQGFVQKANLTAEDVNTGMNIMSLMKNDPAKAHEALQPIFANLEALVGVRVPPDLQQQVTEGKITAQHAQELSKLRATTGLTTAQQEQKRLDDEAAAKNQQTQVVETLKNDVGTAITNWETRWKASDPDYSLKHARVSEAIELELHRRISAKTLPTSVEEAVKMAEDVKKKVEKDLLKFVPKRQATGAVPTGPGSTNGSKPVAKTLHDAVAQAIGFR